MRMSSQASSGSSLPNSPSSEPPTNEGLKPPSRPGTGTTPIRSAHAGSSASSVLTVQLPLMTMAESPFWKLSSWSVSSQVSAAATDRPSSVASEV